MGINVYPTPTTSTVGVPGSTVASPVAPAAFTFPIASTFYSDAAIAVTATGKRFRCTVTAGISASVSASMRVQMVTSTAASTAAVNVRFMSRDSANNLSSTAYTTLHALSDLWVGPGTTLNYASAGVYVGTDPSVRWTITGSSISLSGDVIWDIDFASSGSYTFTPGWSASSTSMNMPMRRMLVAILE